jgi:hypothetical protein
MQSEKSKYPKFRIWVTIGVIALIVFVGINAIRAYNGEFDKNYEYTPIEHSSDTLITGIMKNDEEFKISVNYNLKMNTTSLSAQNPLFAEIHIYPSQKYTEIISNQWERGPPYLYVIFPYALVYNTTINSVIPHHTATMKLTHNDNPREYYGNLNLIYQFEGNYGYLIVDQDFMDTNTEKGITYYSSTVLNSVPEELKYKVGSSDLTSTLKLNDIFLALTLAFIAFSIAELREHIISAFTWFYEIWKLKRFPYQE